SSTKTVGSTASPSTGTTARPEEPSLATTTRKVDAGAERREDGGLGGTIFVDIPGRQRRRRRGVGPVPRPRSEMPQLGPLEIAVVLLIALLVFGPNRLPELAKQVGGALRELKRIQQ